MNTNLIQKLLTGGSTALVSPKKLFPVLIFSMAMAAWGGRAIAQSTSWVNLAPMPAGRSTPAVAAVNGIVYVAGGYNGVETATLQAYNSSTNTWTTLAPMPDPRYEGDGMGVINGQLYVPGGWTSTSGLGNTNLPNSNLYVYDPPSNTWSTKASMPLLSGGGATGVINNKLYVTTPDNGNSGYYSFLDVYDPVANTWTSLPNSPVPHINPAYGVINGKFYLVGGLNGSGVASGELDVYDPVANTWSTLAAMPTTVVNAASAVVNNELYVIGGGPTGGTIDGAVYIYNPATNTWAAGPALAIPVQNAAAAVINNTIYLMGGQTASGQAMTTAEALTTAVNSPVVGPSITTQPASETAAVGQSATFTVVATGSSALTYQWYFNGAVIGGATSSGFTISSVSSANYGAYTVIVTDSAGSVTSNPASLSQPPIIFVANSSAGTIGAYNRDGTVINASLISGLTNPGDIVVSGPNLFVVNQYSGTSVIGEYTTSGATVYATLITSPYGSGAGGVHIALSGSNLFIANGISGTVAEYTTSGALVNPSLITGINTNAIAVSGSNLFVSVPQPPGQGNPAWGNIAEYTTSGTLVNASLMSNVPAPSYMVVSGSSLFELSAGEAPGSIVEFPIAYPTSYTAGGPYPIAVSQFGGYSQQFAIFGQDIFVTGNLTYSGNYGYGEPNSVGEYSTSGATINLSLIGGAASLQPNPLNAPTGIAVVSATSAVEITVQPVSQAVAPGASAMFSVVVTGSPSYLWFFDGQPITTATNASYTVTDAQTVNSGSYTVVATNSFGSAIAIPAILTIDAPSGGPAIASQPASQTVANGSTVVFSVTPSGTVQSSSQSSPNALRAEAATGTNVTYQWFLNGLSISGATDSFLVTKASTSTAGSYTCLVSNANGTVLSNAATLTVVATSNPGRLVNLSVLTVDGPGNQLLTVGFVSGGSGTTGAQDLLIRATGPALTAFGVSNVLPDPTLSVFSGSTTVASGAGWGGSAANEAAVTAADSATGAFPLNNPSSLDSALVLALPTTSGYSVEVNSKGGNTGTTLAEVYDNTPSGTYTAATPRLINLSCRQLVSASGTIAAGFVVGGSTAETVLIRATGPALAAAPFNLTGTMPDPTLTIYTGSTVTAYNDGWGGDPQITAADSEVYAFPLTNPSSNDSALLVTLPPGAYTVQVKSASGKGGIILAEIYEVP